MLDELEWLSLDTSRDQSSLLLFHKIHWKRHQIRHYNDILLVYKNVIIRWTQSLFLYTDSPRVLDEMVVVKACQLCNISTN